MWMSLREAAGLLAGLGINRESARVALGAGLAGEVRRAGGTHLVAERSVKAVIERAGEAPTGTAALEEAWRAGVFTVRLGPRRDTPEDGWRDWRGADLTAPTAEQLLAASGWWAVSWITQAVFVVEARAGFLMPFVGTIAGIAVVGAEITGVTRDPTPARGRWCRFDLRPPGPWFDDLHGRQLLTAPGPPWVTLPLGRIAG
jgi:hypothetical protein